MTELKWMSGYNMFCAKDEEELSKKVREWLSGMEEMTSDYKIDSHTVTVLPAAREPFVLSVFYRCGYRG